MDFHLVSGNNVDDHRHPHGLQQQHRPWTSAWAQWQAVQATDTNTALSHSLSPRGSMDQGHQHGPQQQVQTADIHLALGSSSDHSYRHDLRREPRPWTSICPLAINGSRTSTRSQATAQTTDTDMASGSIADYRLDINMACGHQHGLGSQYGLQTPAYLPAIAWTMDTNLEVFRGGPVQKMNCSPSLTSCRCSEAGQLCTQAGCSG